MRRSFAVSLLAVLAIAALALAVLDARPSARQQNDLDLLMADTLKNRNEAWLRLHDYILDERESFEILGDDRLALQGFRREYTWFLRDGYLVRSPIRSNGVAISEQERRRYEETWLKDEKDREARQKTREDKKAQEAAAAQAAAVDPPMTVEDVVRQDPQSRFMSEAYFMKFRFEPGNYYLAGREEIDGRPVLKIEYYPTRMFSDEERQERRSDRASGKAATEKRRERDRDRDREQELEDRIDRSLNKVTLVTLWVDPAERQIVRFLFDNADFGFLPYRQIVRVEQITGQMTMGRYFDGVWLPKEIRAAGSATLATGTLRFNYAREFYDYRMGEVRARIRAYVPKLP